MTDTREPASQSSEQLRTDDDIVRYVVANAIWAPSVHNTQPWKFSAEGATDYEYELMRQIRQRRTHRGGFDSLPLSADLLAALRRCAAHDGTVLCIMTEDERQVLAAMVQEAERVQRFDSVRVQELARWAPPPGSGRLDGVPPTSYPARPEHTSPDYPGRDFAHGHGWGLPAFSQPLELPHLRADIRAQLCGGAYPQLVLRLGTITQIAASVRRAPEGMMF